MGKIPKKWQDAIQALSQSVSLQDESIQNLCTGKRFFKGTAVIIEPRRSNLLMHLLQWMSWILLRAGWNLCVMHGIDNEKDIVTWVNENKIQNCVSLKNLNVQNLTISDYNNLLCSCDFWNQFETEVVLIFQSDTVLLDSEALERFSKYDYVGAPWNRGWEAKVGNGGLSLRRKKAMIEYLSKVPYNGHSAEDMFFSTKKAHEIIMRPSMQGAMEFSVETTWHPSPAGYHSPWRYQPTEKMEEIYTRILNVAQKNLELKG
jgi:hypothetical protein